MTRPQKILVLGATGMLGHVLFRWLAKHPDMAVVGTLRSEKPPPVLAAAQNSHARLVTGLDALDTTRVQRLFADEQPSFVINCVGLVKQLELASDPLQAIPVNALLPHQLARACTEQGARLVHISTDCVFSGIKGRYCEDDVPDVTDLYGRSKLLGEVEGPGIVSLRTSMIGPQLERQYGLLAWFLNTAGPVKGYARAVFSGLPTVEVARVIEEHILPNPRLSGVYHLASDPIDKHAFLGLVAREYGHPARIDKDETVVIDRSLDASRFHAATGYTPPAWPELVRRMRAFG
jgi:dTDP-4-dehydrorhamnose reductase